MRLRLRCTGQAASDEEKDWPGPEREREREGRWELYYYHTLTCSTGLVGPARQHRAGCQTGQGSSGPSARPRLCGLQQISLALDTGTATGHSDSSSGTGLVSLRSARLLLLALPEK